MARITLPNRCLLLLAAIMIAVPLYAFPPHHKRDIHDQILALEQQWRKAELSSDTNAMEKLLSDDYLGVTAAGEAVTKVQQLDRMRARHIVLTRLDLSDIKVKLIGHSVAIVNSLATVKGSSDDHPIDGSFRYTHVYQRLPGGIWKITSFEPTRIMRPHNSRVAGHSARTPLSEHPH